MAKKDWVDDPERPTGECPKCGTIPLFWKRGSKTPKGTQRWCCNSCNYQTTNLKRPGQTERVQHSKILKESKRYLITAVQNATPVHKKFLMALKTYCKENGAELVCVPYRYRNPTSIWSEKDTNHEWWSPETEPYLFAGRENLNSSLLLVGDIKVTPTAVHPLTGFDSITGGMSGIIAHPKVQMQMIPTPQHHLPKMMLTTGAVTDPNYTDTKAGKKGEFHHTLGAALVEITDDKTFHIRQINAQRDGTFIDLNRKYSHDKVKKVDRAAALVMGDSHVDFIDPSVVDATFGASGIVSELRPVHLVWHDLIDMYSRSHHHKNNAFINVVKRGAGLDNVMEEVDRAVKFIDKYSPKGVKNIIVPSNHHEHLFQWLAGTDWRTDPENAEMYLETALAVVKGSTMGKGGAKILDPFCYWAERLLKCKDRTKFLKRGESCTIRGIEVGLHGDRGAHGSRGSARQLSRIGVKTIIGHSHVPAIDEGCFQAGTSSRLNLEYSLGSPSGWLHDHVVVYSNGKRSHISVVDGRWRLGD